MYDEWGKTDRRMMDIHYKAGIDFTNAVDEIQKNKLEEFKAIVTPYINANDIHRYPAMKTERDKDGIPIVNKEGVPIKVPFPYHWHSAWARDMKNPLYNELVMMCLMKFTNKVPEDEEYDYICF